MSNDNIIDTFMERRHDQKLQAVLDELNALPEETKREIAAFLAAYGEAREEDKEAAGE